MMVNIMPIKRWRTIRRLSLRLQKLNCQVIRVIYCLVDSERLLQQTCVVDLCLPNTSYNGNLIKSRDGWGEWARLYIELWTRGGLECELLQIVRVSQTKLTKKRTAVCGSMNCMLKDPTGTFFEPLSYCVAVPYPITLDLIYTRTHKCHILRT